jgi:predicted 3-demethylubiquinone-9 3-methyltransferase (glyoxalase superfamily)
MAISFSPFIWYAKDAEGAAQHYTSVIPNSRIDHRWSLPVDTPSGPPGSVTVVEFTLAGSRVMAMTAGPHHEYNDAISLMLECDTQAEIDAMWDGLQQGGGKPVACGWMQDRYGVRWQITPRRMGEWIGAPERAAAARVALAMMSMVKLDIAALEKAAKG